MLHIMQESTLCETRYTVFEHFFMRKFERILPFPTHFIALSINHLIPFPQITAIIQFIQKCDKNIYYKAYLQRFLFWGCKMEPQLVYLYMDWQNRGPGNTRAVANRAAQWIPRTFRNFKTWFISSLDARMRKATAVSCKR